MAKQESMNLIQFQKKFQTEEACHQHLFKMKWPEGYHCPKCQHQKAYEIKTRNLPLYECTNCQHQTTVITGTIFEKTRTDLVKWFWAIYLIAQDKRGVSATYLSDELGIAYQTAWTIQHKVRKAMGERDAAYTLAGIVELDEAFFGAPTEGGKRGRGTEQTAVLVALSLDKKGCPKYLKMQVIPDVKGTTLTDFATTYIEAGSTIASDRYRSYQALAKNGFHHEAKKYDLKENPDHLKWLHTIISNAKAFIGGTYHGLDPKHLQAYLDEFCYRFNRREVKSELFNRLVHCCLSSTTITYPELVG
ncbi:IS1595 family transposase [Paenibacillus alginolyticus]|uniref:IS1595 family transposase n=22 Tax=Paenibacillus alginolyticus TaxID=59839 RepID=A0ABT4GAH6_9BACL|nr:IS1595 family transposase [Paenibacillus alginolyticus]MCY9669537.1 IS1595 family transposase [Paenibacillus alginolyticus]MCY9693186.1 IS1595 family transposase [Paenibacillus alginolyticus]MEC0144519.1 IS1595 family transposase [Paenibacillus alginolyticus]